LCSGIAIQVIISSDKLVQFADAFQGYTEESLSGFMEKHGDTFSWEDVRMFKANLNLQL
jgi:hypothetical protein